MPIPDEFSPKTTAREWKSVPEGVYQTVLKDIDIKDIPKYQSTELETKYLFKFVILDDVQDAKHEMVVVFTTQNWFVGKGKSKSSNLVRVIKAFYAFYHPKVNVSELTDEDVPASTVNQLIGKQLTLVVKVNEDGTSNKVTDFLSIKSEMPVPEEIKIAEVKAAKKSSAKKKDEDEDEEVKHVLESEGGSGDLPFD